MNHVPAVFHEEQQVRRMKTRVALIPAAVAVLWCVAPLHASAAGVLPAGGNFVAGSGSISANGSTLTVNQTSGRGVVDWNSFSIGANNNVVIANGSGATLNRVTGGSPSMILGSLTASGSVYLINPQGVLVGPGGVISTGGRFVASTLDADNNAFMNNAPLALTGNGIGGVVNLGSISSTGGDVFLIAKTAVMNGGTVSAPNGTAELAVGAQVMLQDSSSSKQVFVQPAANGSTSAGGTVLNAGTIQAAQVNLQAMDGNIYAMAANHEAIRATGTATRDGHVWLVAGRGTVSPGGTIAASAGTNTSASGGTVDMSANTITFPAGGTTVTANQWNLSTPTFTINPSAAQALSTSLGNGTSVALQTTGGDINVNSGVNWQGNGSLTLAASHSVNVAQGVTVGNTGAGNLTLHADAGSVDNGGSVTNAGTIDWSHSTGIVSALYDMNGTYGAGTLLGNSAWAAAAGSGQITQITAYKLVNNVTDLQNVSQNLAGNYALGKDVDATGVTLLPIGNSSTPFTGQFDGMWHSVTNATIVINDFSVDRSSGLFGVVGSTGVLRDVGVDNGNVGMSFMGSGLLAGVNEGLIANSHSSGTASEPFQEGTNFGGLVGSNQGTIERSWSSAAVSGSNANGGLVGYNFGSISQSYATGSITPTFSTGFGGGLVGANAGSISESFATGAVASRFMSTNGVVGFDTETGTIASNVYWNKETTGQPASGGTLPASNGLTTAQMSNPASFAGYNFGPGGAWAMPAGATHPVLNVPVAQQ